MNKIDIDEPELIKKTVEIFKNGGVVMHPTETCYGFAVDIYNQKALDKLYKLKGRDFNKPVSILVDGFGMASEYGIFSEKATELAMKYWPGPLSIVVPRAKNLPDFLNPNDEYVSIRNSSDSFCEVMVKQFSGPVTTTSANVAGESPLYEVDLSQFGDNKKFIDLIVDGGSLTIYKPSTVVKVVDDRLEVLRHGEVNL